MPSAIQRRTEINWDKLTYLTFPRGGRTGRKTGVAVFMISVRVTADM
jgi:hypothetical protein